MNCNASSKKVSDELSPIDKVSDIELVTEPGSFRDRSNRIYYAGGSVLRYLDKQALSSWCSLKNKKFFNEFVEKGAITPTEEITLVNEKPSLDGWVAALKSTRIPFVSYPYEWCFSQLKEAALLHLKLELAALEEGMTLKDSSAYNVQWVGARPVFIDIGSFTEYKLGTPWFGYQQFCEMFLFPLMLQSYKSIPFQLLLRSNLEGIHVAEFVKFLSFLDWLKPGVLLHGIMQAKLHKRYEHSTKNIKSDLKSAGFNVELIKANLGGLIKLVTRLRLPNVKTEWADYANNNSYTQIDAETKASFIEQITQLKSRELVWDLGCNTGDYSIIAARNTKNVIALDGDHVAVDKLYHRCRHEGVGNILPLIMNVANPSCAQGWRGLERKSLEERGKPQLVLCLGLIHHLVISANIPLAQVLRWLSDITSELVLEFVSKEDPMTKFLLKNKDDQYLEYCESGLEEIANTHFMIKSKVPLASGTRTLYYLTKT